MSRFSLTWAACALGLLLTAATLPARADTPPDARLDGNWQLDVQASDSFDDKLAKLAEAMRAKRRNRGGSRGGYDDGGGSGGSGRGGSGAREVPPLMDELPPESRDEMGDRLGETYRPPRHLHIESTPEAVSILGDAPPVRRFNLLETVTRMDVSGTASIRSEWTSKGLTVDSRYTNRSRSLQRFSLDRTGTVLTVTLDLTEPVSGRLRLRSVYHRDSP